VKPEGSGPLGKDEFAQTLNKRLTELHDDASPLARELRETAEAYLKLSERFSKVLAISDKYQLLLNVLSGLPEETRKPAPPKTRGKEEAAKDPLLAALRENRDKQVQTLIGRYEKLNRRINKIVAISDNYQAELRETYTKMELMARTDFLTALSNRRDLIDRLEMELSRVTRQQGRFSVILFDIDDFKKVNDTRGHEAGDQVLVAVAATFKEVLRRSDLCGRWGGEEFLVLCADTGLREALVVAEKCRERIQGLVVPTRHGPVSVTVSGGVGEFSEPSESWEEAVKRADEALYRAKARGKNTVVAAK
jgi:diguanylate cyclase (GGDEF)-like protein